MVETNRSLVSALGRVGIVCGVAIAFILGLTGTVYLSLRSAEVRVPDILGKNSLAGEQSLESAGLNMRRRASRFAPDAKPDTILDQSPRAGETVKAGQTVAVVLSRPPKEGEAASTTNENAAPNKSDANQAADSGAANDNGGDSKNQNGDKKARAQDKDARNKNADSKNGNANSKSNANNSNRNANKRNTNSGNANVAGNSNRNANSRNANNRNSNNRATNANSNRGINNLNANRGV